MTDYPERRAGLLFLSFGTTSRDVRSCEIVEAAWAYSAVNVLHPVIPTPLVQETLTSVGAELVSWDPEVLAAAESSGLAADLRRAAAGEISSASLSSVEEIIISDSRTFFEDARKYPVHIAGYGVASFEHELVRERMPNLHAMLHDRPVDVSPGGLILEWARPGKMSHNKAYRHEQPGRAKDAVVKSFLQFKDQFNRAGQP